MKNSSKTILILLIGFILGGGGVWLYASKYGAELKAGLKETPIKKEKTALFYRNPMNPQVTSPTPKKDEMGMDYVAVYEEDTTNKVAVPGTVTISPERIQKIGVKSEAVKRTALRRVIRTVGRVEPVENKIYIINAKIAGWVERLYVDQTDQMVRKGDKLLELYSPDLVSAQEEYLLALKAFERVRKSPYAEVIGGGASLIEATRQRLKYWDISDDQIEKLRETGKITRTMAIRAASSGSVTEKMVVEGQKIEAGEPLFKIIDHSSVWVYGEIYEYEIPYIKTGQSASLYPAYSQSEVYKGNIEHIYSHLGSIRYAPEEGTEVRTAKVRFALSNPRHSLKLGMYLNVEISVNVAKNALAVPDSAIIDSGARQILIVDKRDGTFEPRDVRVGAKADGLSEILSGVSEGEWAVTSANFLIDSESNLKAAIGAIGHGHKDEKKEATGTKEAPVEIKEPVEIKAPTGHEGHEGH